MQIVAVTIDNMLVLFRLLRLLRFILFPLVKP